MRTFNIKKMRNYIKKILFSCSSKRWQKINSIRINLLLNCRCNLHSFLTMPRLLTRTRRTANRIILRDPYDIKFSCEKNVSKMCHSESDTDEIFHFKQVIMEAIVNFNLLFIP